ncbi:hypothetical protein BABINDRAFT_13437 [Babjeviella inositovora NRRL Y-12698]|uniref:SAGA-associated factor 11 n=1 Tax=Babjeviella inositovora NRRL Y-12698 TaxID=984486 RepID=A0A1E3QS27_9ASCO|nr:uncharacterized protein BABINDRAFT_13437 [Babjeviella inositovora NRRL Y-12698]ODQ79832.1 hypothetical protein BABINDRAFT_13437 [Babjeviella inositovora NRRL Y-12698]
MPEDIPTKASLAISILHDLLEKQIHQLIVERLLLEKQIRQTHHDSRPLPAHTFAGLSNLIDENSMIASTASTNNSSQAASRANSPATALLLNGHETVFDENEKNTRVVYVYSGLGGNRDIYGNEGLKQADASRYFVCSNCTRKIAGSRFAAHVDRCLGGRLARRT